MSFSSGSYCLHWPPYLKHVLIKQFNTRQTMAHILSKFSVRSCHACKNSSICVLKTAGLLTNFAEVKMLFDWPFTILAAPEKEKLSIAQHQRYVA